MFFYNVNMHNSDLLFVKLIKIYIFSISPIELNIYL